MGRERQEEARGEVLLYKGDNGRTVVDVRLDGETVWLTLNQMAALFDRDKSVISRHLKDVFETKELVRKSVVAKNATTAADGKTYQVEYYNLDAILTVGYRVNSKRGTQFRIWATQTLKEHLTRGYTLNQKRLEENAKELEAALQLIRKTASRDALTADEGRGLVDIIARYTQTFLLLQRYDEGLLAEPKGKPGGDLPTLGEARKSIAALKADLMTRGEASALFGQEREEAFVSILGNLEQTVFGEPAYPSVESKASHLIYFVIKNHPFSDGNKRIGSLRRFSKSQRKTVSRR